MSKEGNIGGFTISDGYLTGETQSDGGKMVFNAQSGYNAYINNNDGTFLGIGNVLPATTSVKAGAMFDIRTSNPSSTNIGAILNAQGAGTNIALEIQNGGISVGGTMGYTGELKIKAELVLNTQYYNFYTYKNGIFTGHRYGYQ